jgi:23S rRNA (adenine2503-C2)-methyltransferase
MLIQLGSTPPETVDLCGLPFAELATYLDRVEIGGHHAHRVFRALHGTFQSLRDDLQFGWRNVERLEHTSHLPALRAVEVAPASDGTEKLVITLRDGEHVESVLIFGLGKRITLCVSSQVGCGVGCTFCATAQLGIRRNLEAGEIVAQVHAANRHLGPKRRVSHVVYMGMGEPLQNYDAVRRSVRVLIDTRGPCLESRRITVSTVGLIRRMVQFGADFEGRVQLALSLHAGTDATRQSIIPLARTYPLEALRNACLQHPLPGSRRLMVEYIVIPGVNDTSEELKGVAAWTRDIECIVNLVPFNPFPRTQFRAPSRQETIAVARALQALGVMATIRWPRGRGVNAACGQLALNQAPPLAMKESPANV